MKKTLLVKLPGHEEFSVSYNGRSRSAVIVGIDTAMGCALARSLSAVGFDVIGLGETENAPCDRLAEYRRTDYASYGIPLDCNLVLFCHDAALRADRHVDALNSLCRELSVQRTSANQIHVCLFTPANACESGKGRIRENSPLCPHSLRELAHVQAEMTLHAWCFVSRTAILPNVFRHGELYADMPAELPLAGHVNACLRKRRTHERLESPGLGTQKRTLTHLDDFSDAVAALLRRDFIPSVINIPGETMAIIDYMILLDDSPDGGMAMGTSHDDDLPWGIGDRVLSPAEFKAELPDFKPKYRFKEWLVGRDGSSFR